MKGKSFLFNKKWYCSVLTKTNNNNSPKLCNTLQHNKELFRMQMKSLAGDNKIKASQHNNYISDKKIHQKHDNNINRHPNGKKG